MARGNRNGVRKETVVMLVSSVLVLTALTVTGIFVRGNHKAEKEDYIVDFEAIEKDSNQSADILMTGEELDTLFAEVGTDDLDYDPAFQEANSPMVENNDIQSNNAQTNGIRTNSAKTKDAEGDVKKSDKTASDSEDKSPAKQETKQTSSTTAKKKDEGMFDETVDTAKSEEKPEDAEVLSTTVQPALDFKEEDGLVWPIVGDVLINYSMDKTIYFPTLDQYKYNPAIVISATAGENIAAAADGRVTSVGYDRVIGNSVVMDLGNGYELTYGQLDNITVSEGSYVKTGDIIGVVAPPTKYYSTEGHNVYFKLLKDGEPVNPMSKLQ